MVYDIFPLIEIIHYFVDVYFSQTNNNILRHLKLEMASAIPTVNDGK